MSKYPVIYAGQRITGTLLSSMMPDIMRKLVNTDRASTTTVTDDPDLTATLEANATYYIEMDVWYAATALASGVRTQWTVPAGVTGNRSALGMASTVSDGTPNGIGRWGVHAFTTPVFYGDRGSPTSLAQFRETSMLVTSTTAGTCALQWAQDTADATATRVAAGSTMRVTRLA